MGKQIINKGSLIDKILQNTESVGHWDGAGDSYMKFLVKEELGVTKFTERFLVALTSCLGEC